MTDPVVREHLSRMAAALRAEPGPADARRKAHRDAAIAALEAYAAAGVFPANPGAVRRPPRRVERGFAAAFEQRAPVFVDDAGVRCAVAHLVARTDPDLVETVRRTCNGAWIEEMPVPALGAWADDHGLTIRDLARIQPSYSPVELPLCTDEVPFEAAIEATTAGSPDVAPVGPAHECFRGCDGPLEMWFSVENRGDVDAAGVRVEAYRDGDLALRVDGVALSAGSAALFGPFVFPHEGAGSAEVSVRLDAPGDASTSDDDVTIAGMNGGNGAGAVSECEPEAGCAHTSGGIGLAPLVALLARRRTPTKRPR